MKLKNSCLAAILLLDSKPEAKILELRKWVAENHFHTCEADDVHHALETISDFTLRRCPNVVFLHTDLFDENLSTINKMVSAVSVDGEIPVLVLSDSNKRGIQKDYFEGNFSQIKTKLRKLMPELARRAANA